MMQWRRIPLAANNRCSGVQRGRGVLGGRRGGGGDTTGDVDNNVQIEGIVTDRSPTLASKLAV